MYKQLNDIEVMYKKEKIKEKNLTLKFGIKLVFHVSRNVTAGFV